MSGRLQPAHLPLQAIRAFEAAARLESFKAAADELGLTPSAVSHQIRLLERLAGCRLFDRGRRGVTLTAAGDEFARPVLAAFDLLRGAAARLASDPLTIRISSVPVFARRWLLPSLATFEMQNPGVALHIDVSLAHVDIAAGDADIGIRFGSGDWHGLNAEKLIDVEAAPMCAPTVLPSDSTLEAIADATLLSVTAAPGAWQAWFAAAGKPDLVPRRELHCESLASAIEAARDGVGIVLAPPVFAEAELQSGALVHPHPVRIRASGAYFLVCRRGEEEMPKARRVARWLRTVMGKEVQL